MIVSGAFPFFVRGWPAMASTHVGAVMEIDGETGRAAFRRVGPAVVLAAELFVTPGFPNIYYYEGRGLKNVLRPRPGLGLRPA